MTFYRHPERDERGPFGLVTSNPEFSLGCEHLTPSEAIRMDAEKIIADIEALEHIFTLSDPRPLRPTDITAINEHHDQRLTHNPWFQLWNISWK